MRKEITQAVKILREGGIIAYPTEGVFGLGCDPFNETAVMRLLKIKNRNVKKGLVLIAANWNQVKNLIKKKSSSSLTAFQNNKNDPVTWVFPATKHVPKWIKGNFNSVAIRVVAHKTAETLCQKFKGPIVSTSANKASNIPAITAKEVQKNFSSQIDLIIKDRVGLLKKPTEIRDATTGKIVRP